MPEERALTGKQIIARLLRNTLLTIVLLLAVVYVCDYLVLRIRIAMGRTATGSVTVRPVYAVPQKDKKTEFLVGDPVQQSCVHSIFPHMGDAPCWYLERHTEQRIDM
ncbi:MAG TPA: hypothetical protein VKX25_00715 [Bryobacteraceae bacterium]|jgi:hypothetical protein|nr:hypothetical protein [Bryobacteraceae bacterium]